jgi:hypothetical protein
MKNLKTTFVLAAAVAVFVSCKDENKEKADKALERYTSYVDSVSQVSEDKAAANWEAIESDYARLKADAEMSLPNASDKTKFQSTLDTEAIKYEEFKTNIIAEKEKAAVTDSKTAMYTSLFGSSYVSDDMKFNWVNKDNILSVYDNFVTTVQKNKDSYSREDWDEIKIVYEALDSRKNTVEKEGLSSQDNNKIAGLKLKFAPMYTLNRMGAKSDENAEAKK